MFLGNRTGNPGQAALLGLAYPLSSDPKISLFAWALSHPVSTDPQLTVGHSSFGVLYPNYTGQLAPGGSVSFTFVLTAFRADTPSDIQFLSGSSLNGPNFQVTLPLVTSPGKEPRVTLSRCGIWGTPQLLSGQVLLGFDEGTLESGYDFIYDNGESYCEYQRGLSQSRIVRSPLSKQTLWEGNLESF